MSIDLLEEDFQTFLSKETALQQLRMRAWEKFLPLFSSKLPFKKIFSEETSGDFARNSFENYLFFANGFFQKQALPKKVVALSLAQAMKQYSVFLQKFLFKSIQEEKEPLALLNLACHGRALFLYVPPNIELKEPIEICQFLSVKESSFSNLQIIVGKQSKVDFVLQAIGEEKKSHLNLRIDFLLEEEAEVKFYDLSSFQEESSCDQFFRASLKKRAKMELFFLSERAMQMNSHFVGNLLEEEASLNLVGFSHLKKKESLKTKIEVIHKRENCQSKQHFKLLLDDESRSLFQGKIAIDSAAQKTVAYQLNNNLLLSEKANAKSFPELTILADDVKASHGATFGNLDESFLFYLRSRGLSIEEAKEFLIQGFSQEVYEKLPSYLQSRR